MPKYREPGTPRVPSSPKNEAIPLTALEPEAEDGVVEAQTNGHDAETLIVEPPAPEPTSEPEDEAKTALSKRVAELEAAEKTRNEAHARQLAEWQQRLASAEQQRTTARQEAQQSREQALQAHMDAITNSISAQQELLEGAERDLEIAIAAQDAKSQANATKRITMASSYLAQLETSKTQFESHRETLKTEQPAPEPQPADPIDQMPRLSFGQKQWLKEHRELVADPEKNAYLGAAHFRALKAGHAVDSPGYYASLETDLGYRQPDPDPEPEPEIAPQPTPARRAVPVSAPVSRSTPSPSTGRRESATSKTYTADQVEAAKLSGISLQEYGKQLQRLEREKALGNYPMVQQK